MEKWKMPERAEQPHTLTVFPQGDALVQEYKKEYGADAHHAEVVREAAYTYLDEAIGKFDVFESKNGLAFPHTSVRLRDLAEKIFAAHSGTVMPASERAA